jgi:integrase/recombinase XerD
MVDEKALTALQDRALAATGWQEAGKRPLADVVKAALAAAGKSENTRRGYLTAFGQFLTWLDGERGSDLPQDWRPLARASKDGKRTAWDFGETPAAALWLVDAAALDTWRLALEAGGASSNTAAVRVYAVRTLLSVALRDGVLPPDQGRNLGVSPYRARQTRDEKPVGRRLTVQEVRKLRVAPDLDTAKGKRDLAVLDCQLYLGLRRAEVAGLRLSDFSQDGGRWWVTLVGKGGKTRRLKVADVLYQSLTAWLDAAELYWHDDRPLFFAVDKGDTIGDNALSPNDVGRLVAMYGSLAHLAPPKGPGRLGAHDLRRTAARNAYDNGATLLQVQQMLGHSDPKTTARYIGANQDDTDTATDYVRY